VVTLRIKSAQIRLAGRKFGSFVYRDALRAYDCHRKPRPRRPAPRVLGEG
jgi:hypothetical protein